MQIHAVDIARALIRCPSVTPAEGGALAYLEQLLSRHGFACRRLSFREAGTPDVENLYARFGTSEPVLMFAGHTDVVPAGEEAAWTRPPFSADIEDGELYGRGAVDMKGGIAAFAAAAIDYLAARPDTPGSIAFLITGDEEGPAVNGTRKLLDWAREAGERFDAAIVGEPTNPERLGDEIKIGRRGSLSGKITVEGRQGHVAYPHLAANPIPPLVHILASLTEAPLDTGSEHFQASNLEVTSIDVGNTATNVIPARATAAFNIRFNDLHTADSLKERVRGEVAAGTADGVSASVAFEPTVSDVFLTRDDALVEAMSAAVEEETGRRPRLSTGGGTSDARFIKDHCPVIEFGLVGRTMHQVDERVALDDLEGLTRIYRRFLESYFS